MRHDPLGGSLAAQNLSQGARSEVREQGSFCYGWFCAEDR